jgi:hypothetical protein
MGGSLGLSLDARPQNDPDFRLNRQIERKLTRDDLKPMMNCELCGRDGAEPARLDDERDALLCRECRDNYLPPEGPV